MTQVNQGRTRTHRSRVLTGIVLVGVALGLGVSGLVWPLARGVLVTVLELAVLGCVLEYAQLCGQRSVKAVFVACLLALPLLAASWVLWGMSWPAQSEEVLALCAALGIVGMIVALVSGLWLGRADLQQAVQLGYEFSLGVLLLVLGGSAWAAMVLVEGGPRFFLWGALVVALNDIAAYYGGSKIGGPKLAPAISPAKTFSGSMCGLAAGLVGGLLLGVFCWPGGRPEYIALGSVAVGIVAQSGDLAKSTVKRLHSVKDSGAILPGHGGLLDRLDGHLLAAPLVLVLIFALG